MTDAALHPVTLRPEHLRGEQLPPFPLWPAAMLPRPMDSHRKLTWYAGKDLTCMVYESDDGTVDFTDLPYDEHVYLLHGQAILTSADGAVHVYDAGDAGDAPKGWTGTWEMRDGYRELICFETRAILTAAKEWWPELSGRGAES